MKGISRVIVKFKNRKLKYQVMANRMKLMEKKNVTFLINALS